MTTKAFEPIVQVPLPAELKHRLKQLQNMKVKLERFLYKEGAKSRDRLFISQRHVASAALSLLSIGVTGFCVPKDVLLAVGIQSAIALAVGVAAFKALRLPKSFEEELDAQLLHYDPVDKLAFKSLQATVKSSASNELTPRDFFNWVSAERIAIESAQRKQEDLPEAFTAGIKNSNWKFVTKTV